MAIFSKIRAGFNRFFRGGSLRAFLLRGFLGSGALKIFHTLLTLAVAILLARALGPEGYGIYAYAYALASLLAIPAQVGLPTLVVREVARYHLEEKWGYLKGILRYSTQVVLGLTTLLMFGTFLVIWLFAGGIDSIQLETFAWALLLVPLIALGNLRGAALQGLRKVVQGQLPEMLLLPALLLIFVGIALGLNGGELTPPGAMVLHSLAAGLAFFVGVVLLLRAIPIPVRTISPAYESKAWFRSILPLSFISGMQIINTQASIVLLGLLTTTSSDVGIYRVAVQGATVVSFGLMMINTVIAPQISRLYHSGDRERLQRMVTWSARAILATSLPLAAVLIFFGAPILQLVFGEEYASGDTALAIMCLGQLVNAAMGSVAFLLNMTGHERDTAKGLMIAAIINILLNLMLIPPFGIEGAAMATAFSLAGWNIILYRLVRMRIGIDSSAIGWYSKKVSHENIKGK